MPSSYCPLAVHIIFSTKDRYRWLEENMCGDVFAYINGIIREIKGDPIITNGVEDHVHILCLMPRDSSLAEFVRTIKSCSSKWVHEKKTPIFGWQTGCAAYSVSLSQIPRIRDYVAKQEEHHKRVSFEEEWQSLLEAHSLLNGVTPDGVERN